MLVPYVSNARLFTPVGFYRTYVGLCSSYYNSMFSVDINACETFELLNLFYSHLITQIRLIVVRDADIIVLVIMQKVKREHKFSVNALARG